MTATTSPVVHYSTADGVGTIALDRPRVNAYDIGLMEALGDCLEMAEGDSSVHVVILRSAIRAVFSVGADIKAWSANDTAGNQRLIHLARANADAMAGSAKVFIAAVSGHALGGGLELALACDLRFGAEGDYRLGLPEVKLGLMPGNGGTQRLLRLVGPGRAFELIATGESVDPTRALAIGLLDRLIPAADLQADTEDFARSLAAGPTQAIAAIKSSLREGADLSLEEGLAVERRLADGLYGTPDATEGFKAYVEKRPPLFGRQATT